MSSGSSSIARLPNALMRAAGPAVSAVLRRLGAEPLPFAGFKRALPCLRTGSPDKARALYAGLQPLGFAARNSRNFSWLADLEAGGLDLHRAFARKQYRAWQAVAGESDLELVAHRVLNVCRHGGFLLSGASTEFAGVFAGQLGADVRRLTQARIRIPDEAVVQSVAVLAAALCFGGPERLAAEAAARLAAAAEAVILPDGGHISRGPDRLLATLELLVPLRDLMADMRVAAPRALNAAIERAFPMLRLLCHGDGGLSLLQNASGAGLPLAGALLALDRVAGRTPVQAKFSGFARLNLGATTVLADCGGKALCDSALAIEFSDGPHRIAGGCGFPLQASAAWMEAAARPAAHATLDIRGHSSVAADRLFRRATSTTAHTSAEVVTSPHGMLCKAQSSRYVAAYGIRHHRELFLAADGCDFRGEDRFERAGPIEKDWPQRDLALRFHLHPEVRASEERASGGIRIALPNDAVWQFTARGGDLALEESVFLATGGASRPCQQIVIRGALGRPDIVNWAFRRQSSRGG